MSIKCRVCGKRFVIKTSKAAKFVIPVCCEECLFRFISGKSGGNWALLPVKESPLNFKSPNEAIVFRKLKQHFRIYYEPFIIEINQKPYLPDFYLPDQRLFIEVKGNKLTRFAKIVRTSKHFELYVITSECIKRFGWEEL